MNARQCKKWFFGRNNLPQFEKTVFIIKNFTRMSKVARNAYYSTDGMERNVFTKQRIQRKRQMTRSLNLILRKIRKEILNKTRNGTDYDLDS